MKTIITDASTAVGSVAYKLSQIIPIYPITPSSPMAECASSLCSKGVKNILGEDVKMIEMQSEAGVAGVLHGALSSHSLSSTFTSSQGLLLMIPNMFKLAGECLPAVIHVASRAVASHALSIFCDHSDIMSVRSTGCIMLGSFSVQEAAYLAPAAHLIALKCSLPVLHHFDGFRTSHEYQKIKVFEDEELKNILENYPKKFINSYQDKQYGTAQNPDVFFQNRERNTDCYQSIEKNVLEVFDIINKKTNSNFKPFEYVGNPKAENIIISMGSSCETIEEYIKQNKNEKIGLVKIRLFRPFINHLFLDILPKSIKTITVLDRTKENGAKPPLYLDVVSAINSSKKDIKILSGRYGLGGKDFTPSCVNAVYKNMQLITSKDDFTVGIDDDMFNSSLPLTKSPYSDNCFAIKIFGLGSDGSVSASKSTIKILGENYDKYVQGYFEYDSKKSGSLTISHLRLSDNPIKSEYLVSDVNLISINNYSFVTRYNCLDGLKENGSVLINTIFNRNEIGRILPKKYVEKIKETHSKLFVIDGQKLARENGLGSKINIIMQAALFKCTNLLSTEDIIKNISKSIEQTFAIKGKDVVEKNIIAMKIALSSVEEVDVSSLEGKEYIETSKEINDKFYNDIMLPIKNLKGNDIKVSKFEADGSTPLATSKYEKRGIASKLPNWIKENCIQCGQCVIACPHSALKALLIDANTPKEDFVKAIGLNDKLYKILLSPDDCTGCGVCAKTCPAIKKALEMVDTEEIYNKKVYEYKEEIQLKQEKQTLFSESMTKGLQFKNSLFEFSGACAGCGETSYIKILTMLNGSNMMIANATGCSSIYGGTFGACPYGTDENGGIFWANSLFEDNAEFGLGIKLGSQYNTNKDKKIWIIGGDGWANDIGYGGLDHVLASGEDVNILVLDNQSYSNTGGQASKATPTGASVKFADSGKSVFKKNLGLIALSYKDVFVGQIALGGNMNHAIKTLKEAQDYKGVSIVIAYSPCVNQGFDLSNMMSETKQAVDCGFWPLYKYNPMDNNLELSSQMNSEEYLDFLKRERRFQITIEKGKDYLLEKQKLQAETDYESLIKKSKTE